LNNFEVKVCSVTDKPRVAITYCTQCRWLLRAAWLAQELLSTFESELGEVALVPSKGGIFEIRVNGKLLWSRQVEGRFPEAKEVKQRVRDSIAPTKDLGHADR
jgi:selenoprotein W-related protein